MTLREKLDYALAQTRAKIGLAAEHDTTTTIRKRTRSLFSRVFPQWLRTMLVVVIEMSASMTWLAAVSNYKQLAGALPIAVLHPVAVAIATHVWPTRTPPWRTLVWTWLASWLTASILFVTWHVDWALYAAIGVVILITVARCNANARRLWNWLVAKRIERAFGPGAELRTAPRDLPSASERYALIKAKADKREAAKDAAVAAAAAPRRRRRAKASAQ